MIEPVCREVIKTGQPRLDIEIYAPTVQSGETRYYQVSWYPLRNEKADITGVNVVVHDITEQKQMEEELRRARDEMEIRVQERTAELAKTNAALAESENKFRLIAETVQGVFWMQVPDSKLISYISPAFERISGRPAGDLPLDPMKIMNTVHPEDQGRVLLALGRRFRGEIYESEEQLQLYAEELERANRGLGDFNYIAAHDLQGFRSRCDSS